MHSCVCSFVHLFAPSVRSSVLASFLPFFLRPLMPCRLAGAVLARVREEQDERARGAAAPGPMRPGVCPMPPKTTFNFEPPMVYGFVCPRVSTQHTNRLTLMQSSRKSIEEAAPAEERLQYLFALAFPPRWCVCVRARTRARVVSVFSWRGGASEI